MIGPAEPAAGAASGISGPAAGGVSESDVEDAALGWLAALGWTVAHGPDVAPDAPAGAARPPQTRLPAGQAGARDPHRPGAGGGPNC